MLPAREASSDNQTSVIDIQDFGSARDSNPGRLDPDDTQDDLEDEADGEAPAADRLQEGGCSSEP